MNKFDKLFKSILSEMSRGNVPRVDHDDKATMYGAPVDKLVKNTKELDAKYGKPKPKKELKLERKYPAKAPKGDSFIKSTGVPSRVDSRMSPTDQYVRTHKNPTTTHGKKFGTRKESTISAEQLEEDKQRLDPKCWKGYRKQGTKVKDGVRVNNCVKIKK